MTDQKKPTEKKRLQLGPIDSDNEEALLMAAKHALNLDYEIEGRRRDELMVIQRKYLLNQTVDASTSPFKVADMKRIVAATEKYQKTLRKSGPFGIMLADTVVDNAVQLTALMLDGMQYDEEHFQIPHNKRGNPGKNLLRGYIYLMARWYREYVAEQPGYGTDSLFPAFIISCLAIIDDEWADKDPPYKTIQNVLTWMRSLEEKVT